MKCLRCEKKTAEQSKIWWAKERKEGTQVVFEWMCDSCYKEIKGEEEKDAKTKKGGGEEK